MSNEGFLSSLRAFVSKLSLNSDLTRMSMPASLILPRSMHELQLELMLPKFWLLVAASRQNDALERLLGVVEYFVTSYFSSTKIARKPLNPVLGEVYRADVSLHSSEDDETSSRDELDGGDFVCGQTYGCLYGSSDSASDRRKAAREHVREASHFRGTDVDSVWTGEVQTLVEQISHHPPRFAAHAHHRESGVTVMRELEISVRFLGTYAQVDYNGQIAISLARPGCLESNDDECEGSGNDEHYVFSQPPNVVFRLLRLQTEYSGKVTIFCPQTGLGAKLKFKEKPTFGGNWHDVKGHIFRVVRPQTTKKSKKKKSSKKAADATAGEASFTTEKLFEMDGNWLTGVDLKPVHTEYATFAPRSFKRHEIPRMLWEEYPSFSERTTHHIWGDVIRNLMRDDVPAAGTAKNAVEVEQRRLAEERKRSGVEYQPEFFEEVPSPFLSGLADVLLRDDSIDSTIDGLFKIDPKLPVQMRKPLWRPKEGSLKSEATEGMIRTLIQDECP